MAWWDHEDLKAPQNKSAKYKLAFPEGYSKEELDEARREVEQEAQPIKES